MEKFAKILIIDDDPVNNFLFSKIIQIAGVAEQTDTVCDGKKGIEYLQDQITTGDTLPDVIFLDINMPVMNGWQFLDEYEKLPCEIRQKISLYMLSSSVYHGDLSKAKTYNDVIDYIIKPLTKEVITKIHEEYFDPAISISAKQQIWKYG